jgi:hypothetical protein
VFGANTCWWRCTLSGARMTVRKDPGTPGQGPDLWWRERPENLLLGLSSRGGAGWWGGVRPDTRYRVTRPDDPLLAGVDLAALERLGSLAGTVDWPRHLAEPPMAQITRNVLSAIIDGDP